MTNDLQSKIISLIPSHSLKKQIRLSGFHFSDEDLLTTAYQYAPDFETRIELLQALAQTFSGELKEYVSRLILIQRQMLESFLTQEDDVIYELHIKDTPDAYDERYICRSFHDAVGIIPLFHKAYHCEEIASSRYSVAKRRILSEETGFSEDELGELVLLPGRKVYSVDVYSFFHQAEACSGECIDCDRPCADCHEILFPSFVKHGDAVKFYEYSGEESFGIIFDLDGLPDSECYVIPLDSNAVCYHDFANIHNAHAHIPAPMTERIEPEDLPQRMREDYLACRQYIMETWPPKESIS